MQSLEHIFYVPLSGQPFKNGVNGMIETSRERADRK